MNDVIRIEDEKNNGRKSSSFSFKNSLSKVVTKKDNPLVNSTSAVVVASSDSIVEVKKLGKNRDLYARVKYGILKICDVEQKIMLDFELLLTWDEIDDGRAKEFPIVTKLDHHSIESLEFIPQCYFISAEYSEISEPDIYRINNTYYFFGNWHVDVRDPLELERFPYDRQILKCKFFCAAADTYPWNAESKRPLPEVFEQYSSVAEIYWDLDTWKFEEMDCLFGQHRVVLQAYMSRSGSFYLSNIVFITYIIVLISMSVCAIDVTDYGSRLSVLITAILTAVAFKFVCAGYMPPVSYLTLLDMYVILSFAWLLMIVLISFIIIYLDYEVASQINVISTIVSAVAWTLLHIYIYFGDRYDWFRLSWADVMAGDNQGNTQLKVNDIKHLVKSRVKRDKNK